MCRSLVSTCQLSLDAKALACFCQSLENRVRSPGVGSPAGRPGHSYADAMATPTASGTSETVGATGTKGNISFVVKAFEHAHSQAEDAIFEVVRHKVCKGHAWSVVQTP